MLGIGLSLYNLIMLPWTVRTLDRLTVPSPAVLRGDHELITSGPFRLIRHLGYSAYPCYIPWTALGTLNWLLLALWPLVVAGTFLQSRAEEGLLREKFWVEYEEYAQQTSRFIPGIW